MNKTAVSKEEEKIIFEQVNLIANMHNISLSAVRQIISRKTLGGFIIPEDKKKIHAILSKEMEKYIETIPNFESYRICTLRDMVLEKFPNCKIDPWRLYKGIYNFVYNKKNIEYAKKRYKNNKEYYHNMAKINYEKKKQIYYEEKVKND